MNITANPRLITVNSSDCYDAQVHYAGLYIGEVEITDSGDVWCCDMLNSYLDNADDSETIKAMIGIKVAVM